MYHFPSDLNLDDLVGSEVHQICLGPADVQFRFGSRTCIAVQSRATLVAAESAISVWTGPDGWSNREFQQMLGLPVRQYAVLTDRLLEIQFMNGLVLQLHDDSDQFESLQIYPGGDVLEQIVV